MKSGWDNGLRSLLLLGLLMGARIAFAQTTPTEKTVSPTNPTVVAVRILREDGSSLGALPAQSPVEIGKPLDTEQVAASIRLLYQTGVYADLRAVTYPEAGGVRLDFVAQENLFINQVIIEGVIAPPSESSAAAAMQLSLGQTYRKADIDDAVARLKDALREGRLISGNG